MTLQPNFCGQRRSHMQQTAGQCASVDQYFQFQTTDIQIDPIQFTARQRIAKWDMEAGEVPDDDELVGPVIRDICYGNAHRLFGLNVA